MEITSHTFPGNFREILDSSVPQSTREKHKKVTACNEIHFYIYIICVCACACMHIYVNGTDMNDYPLQQICYQRLDRICPKSRPVDRLGNNSISALFPTPTLPKLVGFFSFQMCPFPQYVWLGLFSPFLLYLQMLKGIRVLSYIQTKIHASFARI